MLLIRNATNTGCEKTSTFNILYALAQIQRNKHTKYFATFFVASKSKQHEQTNKNVKGTRKNKTKIVRQNKTYEIMSGKNNRIGNTAIQWEIVCEKCEMVNVSSVIEQSLHKMVKFMSMETGSRTPLSAAH